MKILGLGIVLIVLIAAASARSGCSCGFGEGSNPCPGSNGHGGGSGSGMGIKAHKLSKPIHQASPSVIAEAEKERKALAELRAAQAAGRFTVPRGSSCSGIAAIDGDNAPLSSLYQFGHEPQNDESVRGSGLSPSELLALGSKALIAPRFLPVGDLCFPGSSSEKPEHQHAIVVPAKPGKPMCSSCNGLQADDRASSHDDNHDDGANIHDDTDDDGVNIHDDNHDDGRGDGGDEVQNDGADHYEEDHHEDEHVEGGDLVDTTSQSSGSQASALRASRLRGGFSQAHRVRGSNSRGSRARGMSSRGNRVHTSSPKNSHVSSAMHRNSPSIRSPSKSSCGCRHGSQTSYKPSNVGWRQQDNDFSQEEDDEVDDFSNGSNKMINHGHGHHSNNRLATNGNYKLVDLKSNPQIKSFDYGPVDTTRNQQVKSFAYGPARSSVYGQVNGFNNEQVGSFNHVQGNTCGTRPLSKLMSHVGVGSHPLFSALSHENYGKTAPNFDDFDVDAPARALSFAEQERIYNGHGKTLPAVPADPVSVAIAYRKLIEPLQHLARGDGLVQGREKSEAETSLYFGHKTTPADGREQVVERDVPEEGLNTVDKPIVELQIQGPPLAGLQLGSFVDQTENQGEGQGNAGTGAFISYGDLGYGLAPRSDTKFVTQPAIPSSVATSLPSVGAYEAGEGLYKPIGKPLPGYVAGGVVFGTNDNPEDKAKEAAMASVLAEEEANDRYISEEDDGITTDCQQPGDVIQSSSQYGSQSGGQYGSQSGSQYGGQYGSQSGSQYGGQSGSQYGSQSSTSRPRMLSNSWSRAAKSDCAFTS